jgi:hypothetical protein
MTSSAWAEAPEWQLLDEAAQNRLSTKRPGVSIRQTSTFF